MPLSAPPSTGGGAVPGSKAQMDDMVPAQAAKGCAKAQVLFSDRFSCAASFLSARP